MGWKGFLAVISCALHLACVSRTTPDQRFQESAGLPSPDAVVSLPDPEHFTFAIVGDLHLQNGDTTRFRKILQRAATEGDAFLFLLGDIVDKGTREDFLACQQAVSELGWNQKAFPVIGNHDVFHEGWAAYREIYGPSHYSLTLGNTDFVVIDTADGAVGQKEADWLSERLVATSGRRVFVMSHYLPMIPGLRTYLKLADEKQASRLMKQASLNGVTGWLGAHYHSFLTGTIEGVDYVVAGGGGGRRMAPIEKFFFVQVKVDGPEVSYEVREVD